MKSEVYDTMRTLNKNTTANAAHINWRSGAYRINPLGTKSSFMHLITDLAYSRHCKMRYGLCSEENVAGEPC